MIMTMRTTKGGGGGGGMEDQGSVEVKEDKKNDVVHRHKLFRQRGEKDHN